MNPIVLIMLIFAAVGFLDMTFDLKKGMSEEFKAGFSLIPTLLIASVGVSSVGVTLIGRHLTGISRALRFLPFNPGVIFGTLLAPDLGGLPICVRLSDDPSVALLNGVVLTALIGQTISFQIPVFMSTLDKADHDTVIRGFILGLGAIPAGFLAASLLLKVSAGALIREAIPVFLFCAVLLLGLFYRPRGTIRIVKRFSTFITWLIYGMFFYTMAGVFFPSLAYADLALVQENVLAIVKACVIAGGAMVLAFVVRRLFPGPIRRAADKLGVNETSVICLLLGMVSSLVILPLFHKMDTRGKLINSAFSVSGAYLLGGQMGYVASLTTAKAVTVYLIAKAVCGAISIAIALASAKRSSDAPCV